MVAKKARARTVKPPFVGTALMAHAQDTRHLKSLLEEVQALIDARKFQEAKKVMKSAEMVRVRLDALEAVHRQTGPGD